MNYPQIKPTLNLDFSNTKTLDPRITFRRGTPGTYYDGVTHVKAEENLLSYSENFNDSLWSKLGTSLEATTEIAPDGSQNAFFLKQNSANSQHAIYARDLADLGKTYSISIYAKAGTVSRILLASIFTNEHVIYDLSSGEFERYTYSSKLIKSYNMESAGNGWYRCSIVYESANSNNGIGLYLLDDNDELTFIGDNSSGVYIWGAQLEKRDTVTSYTATNGTPITKYQPKLMTTAADRARFDHDPITGESKGLLIEEGRTNLFSYSEDLNSFSANGNIVVNKEKTIAPDGSFCGSIIRYDEPDTNIRPGQHIYSINNISSSQDVSTSFYAKTINQANVVVNTGSCVVLFDLELSESTVLQNDNGNAFQQASIENVGNGWFRCTVIALGSGSSAQYQISPWLSSIEKNWANRYHNGDSNSGVFLWGLQLELGSFPTSYIKTTGASATRSADNASITGENFSSWYRQDEGAFQIDFNHQYDDASWDYILSINPSTEVGDYDQNNLSLRRNLSNGKYRIRVVSSGSNLSPSFELDGVFYENNFKKLCFSYDRNNIYFSNKNQLISDSISDSLRHLKALYLFNIDGDDTRAAKSTGHIKKLSYYPQRLTNEQLQNLTK